MSLFVAEADQSGLANIAQRFAASVVHVDDGHGIVWLWVPDMHLPLFEIDEVSLFVWNSGLPGAAQPQSLAQLDLSLRYKGLVHLVVRPETLNAQRSSLGVSGIEPAPWPDTGKTLQDIVDAVDPEALGDAAIRTLRAIALYAASQTVSPGSQMSLQTWLASTAIPKAKKDLAIFSAFADAVGQRPNLFDELERLVLARRLVILLGGRQSCLKEFLTGFQKNIEQNPATRFAHVTASFNSEHFRQIYGAWNGVLEHLAELDCLFAALAFAAVNGLKNKTGTYIPPYLTTHMLDRPLVFARLYLSNAVQHDDHWQCIHHFLSFLRDAVQAAGIAGEITIFLPFEEIEDVINGNEEAHRQLWQGLGALRDQLKSEPDQCPPLGIVLAVSELAIDQMTEQHFVRQVLTIPPLSHEEIGRLLESFWGSPADTEEVNAIEEYSGGDPWFIFQLFRCLKLATEVRSKANKPVRGADAITEVCQLTHKAVCGADQDDPQKPIPEEVREACEIYLAECSEILRQYQGELGTRKVLTAWKHGEAFYHTQRRKMDKFELAWILTGLVYTQARGAARVDSLESLHEYPVYQFCRAGKLPLAFAERVLKTARG